MNNRSKKQSWRKLAERVIFRNRFIGLLLHDVITGAGKEAEYVILEYRKYTTCVTVTSEGKIVLIKQYRYPWDESTFECPSGIIEENEDPLISAKREVKEETGYQVDSMDYILCFHPSGMSKTYCNIYFARLGEKGEQNLDENEEIEVFEFSVEEVRAMLDNGDIVHAPSLLALHAAFNKQLI